VAQLQSMLQRRSKVWICEVPVRASFETNTLGAATGFMAQAFSPVHVPRYWGRSVPSLHLRIHRSVFGDPRCDLAAGGQPKFDQYVRDVGLGCSLSDDKSFRDGLVAKTLREQ
jgi:hypothetical protein